MKKYEYLDLASIRARLAGVRGREYWRSLEELAESDAFGDLLEREFPRHAATWEEGPDRRRFLKLMGASLGLAGLTACTRQPAEHIMPYVKAPEELVPGKPVYYATAFAVGGIGMGVLVESHEGRPTKVEGNPDHPASLGATNAMAQASVLSLYDPDRSQTLTYQGDIRSWGSFLTSLREALDAQQAKQGAGLRILTETVTSPTLADQIRTLLSQFPLARWHQWDPAGPHSARAAAVAAFGEPVNTYYRLENADIIVSLDADFLTAGPASVRYARAFADRRRVRGDQTRMNRLYVVESTPSPTGGKADHRLPLKAREIEQYASVLAASVGVAGAAAGGELGEGAGNWPDEWITAVAKDLLDHRGTSVVIPGDHQPPAVHVLAAMMNQALGNVGKTVVCTPALEARPADQLGELRALAREMNSGAVELLLILGGNPVYTAPADVGFKEALAKVKMRVHLGLYEDETSALCQWHLPETHYLETWGDTRAYDGTVTIQQPLIAPLYRGRSAHELLAVMMNQGERPPREIVRDYWQRQKPGADFEKWWRKALHDGVVPGTALPEKNVAVKDGALAAVRNRQPAKGIEIVFRPDPYVYDGRFANNGWLQELPRPLTKLTWDNAVLVSPATAQRLGLQNEDRVELRCQGRKVTAPVLISPGHARDSLTVHLGFGRGQAGRVGSGVGFNAYLLWTANSPWFGSGVEIRKTGSKYPLAATHNHHSMEGRHIAVAGDIEEYRRNPRFAQEKAESPPAGLTLYEPWKYPGAAWGMAIDMTACVNCNACVVACQAENNIPVVGKDQVQRGREMHWLRVDTYFQGSPDNPKAIYQPVTCMQCENAPCELVCPVQATNHSDEGLNDMVYNRCVGTRYCSNNCPYKVRRFNFLLYSDFETPSLKLLRNPDVTVRSRGVMEKCTYCVQRIRQAQIAAQREDRAVRDGEIQTACQQVCPTQAIVFGDINDKNSRVAKLKAEKLNFAVLGELNTRPRTTYLAQLRNPNPEMHEPQTGADDPANLHKAEA